MAVRENRRHANDGGDWSLLEMSFLRCWGNGGKGGISAVYSCNFRGPVLLKPD